VRREKPRVSDGETKQTHPETICSARNGLEG
jgi:hypothetical protein